MSRSRERVDRINQHVSIMKVLYDYGYHIHMGGEGQEQQFSCDLHGDGQDNKPSARVYPESNSWYCFACMKSRDALATVMEKEGLKFHEACAKLERKLGLPPLPWEDYKPPPSPHDQIAAAFSPSTTFGESEQRIERFLKMLTKERVFSMLKTLRLWRYFDSVCWHVHHGGISEKEGIKTLDQFRQKLQNKITEGEAK